MNNFDCLCFTKTFVLMRSEVPTLVLLCSQVFWNVTLCVFCCLFHISFRGNCYTASGLESLLFLGDNNLKIYKPVLERIDSVLFNDILVLVCSLRYCKIKKYFIVCTAISEWIF
jgi:hypothetical protein